MVSFRDEPHFECLKNISEPKVTSVGQFTGGGKASMNLFQIAENFLRTPCVDHQPVVMLPCFFPLAPRGLNRELYKLVY